MPQTLENVRRSAQQSAAEQVQKREKNPLQGLDFAAQQAALSPVQQRADGSQKKGGADAEVQVAAAEGVKGAGAQLPHLDRIQQAFGQHDVTSAKAAVGGKAREASQSIGAEAYATGDSVAFAEAPDLHTAAHEAAHVVQQRQGVQLSGGVGKEGDGYERQADAVADAVVQGKSAEGLLSGKGQSKGPGVQKQSAHGAAVQKETTAGAAAPGELTSAQAASAVAFNQGKALKPAAWTQIAGIVKSSSKVVDTTMVKAIAAWQAKQGLTADGKVGDITMGWLAQESGGAGLENLVKSDNVLYVGLNPAARNPEHNQLAGQGAKVTAVKGEAKQGTAKVGAQTVDLSTADGIKAFVDSLQGGLDKGRRDLLTQFISNADFAAKDEVAQIARELHRAESGQTIFTRVVLSGHSHGWAFWGDDNGYIPFDDLQLIRAIFPKATGCVQDLCMSACNTGQVDKLEQYRAIFPNVKSIWAYVGYSPSAATGALRHIGNWEKATRGALDEGKLDVARTKTGAGGGKNDKHVATWTKNDDGKTAYKTDSEEASLDFATLKSQVDAQMPAYDKAFNQGIIDKTALSALYTNLQNLVGGFASQLPDVAKYELVLKRTLYLRYWENVTKKFIETYGAKVKAGYAAAGQAMPAYSGASRDKVLGWIASYPGSGEARALLGEYLRDLNPDKVPVTWA